MVKVRVIGGLGNQMFQYAAAKSLAKKHGVKVSVNIASFKNYKLHSFRLDRFSCDCDFDSNSKLYFKLMRFSFFRFLFLSFNIHIEKSIRYSSKVHQLNKNVFLFGYFQSEKYFLDIRDELIEDFSLKNPLTLREKELEKKITSKKSVALHIRRGDYISNASANAVHGLCDEKYFSESIEYFKEMDIMSDKTVLFVFSDDIAWCEKSLSFDYQTEFVKGSSERPEVDMYLMSKCEHQIISNSTYSWWAAWLNTNKEKHVVAPRTWFKSLHDSKDLVPDSWKRI